MKLVHGLLLTLGTAAAALVLSAGPANAGGHHDVTTGPNIGIANGNVIQFPIFIPINACGNNGAILGLIYSDGHTTCVNH
jgi:hypothetical protein